MIAPQYDLTVMANGVVEHTQPLDDPFITSTITVLRQDFERLDDDLVIVVRVNGTRAALAHVFAPMDLSPNDEQPETIAGAGVARAEL